MFLKAIIFHMQEMHAAAAGSSGNGNGVHTFLFWFTVNIRLGNAYARVNAAPPWKWVCKVARGTQERLGYQSTWKLLGCQRVTESYSGTWVPGRFWGTRKYMRTTRVPEKVIRVQSVSK